MEKSNNLDRINAGVAVGNALLASKDQTFNRFAKRLVNLHPSVTGDHYWYSQQMSYIACLYAALRSLPGEEPNGQIVRDDVLRVARLASDLKDAVGKLGQGALKIVMGTAMNPFYTGPQMGFNFPQTDTWKWLDNLSNFLKTWEKVAPAKVILKKGAPFASPVEIWLLSASAKLLAPHFSPSTDDFQICVRKVAREIHNTVRVRNGEKPEKTKFQNLAVPSLETALGWEKAQK